MLAHPIGQVRTNSQMQPVSNMIRKHLAQPEGYAGGKHAALLRSEAGETTSRIIKLNANENPYEPLPEIAASLANLAVQEYPDQNLVRIREALSEYTGFDPSRIIAGAGGDEIIELMVKLFINPGDSMIDCPPTFGMYEFCAKIADAQLIKVDRKPDWSVGVAEVVETVQEYRSKIVFLASPNNPTGNSLTEAEARGILDTGVVLVVDETYYEFCGKTLARLIDDYENLMIVRSFSKWAGIAGLRIGYAISSEVIIDHLMSIKQPYNVSTAAEAAAIAAIQHRAVLGERIETIVAERQRIEQIITSLDGVSYWQSDANYLLLSFQRRTGNEVYAALAKRGIFVRQFDSPSLANTVRLSIGTPEQNDLVIKALRQIFV